MTAAAALLFSLLLLPAPPPEPAVALYRATLLQAAPGKLGDVLELYRSGWPGLRDSGDEPPIAMRHSQGDRWDLLLLFPIGRMEDHFAAERVARRERAREADRARLRRLADDVAWNEDVLVKGPPVDRVRAVLGPAGFFHIEMFQALPGGVANLVREREMENDYSRRLGLPENLIFVKDSGAAWDVFTVGAYRDLKHYAESADAPAAKQEEAARAAGFEGAKAIGLYLRTLIREHHDTLAVKP